jgi:Gpi18-like mannosyltransferase
LNAEHSYLWTPARTIPAVRGSERLLLGCLLLLTLVSRLLLSAGGTLPGDMEYWVRWSQQLTTGGLRSFYATSGADYLPIYPYILFVLGKLYAPIQHLAASALGWSLSRDTLYKLPAIIADVLTVHLIYVAGRRWSSPAMAGLAATVYAADPAIIADSARWGQVDSIPAYLMVLALVLLIDERPILCGVVLSLSVLTKPTALVLVPLIAVVLLRRAQLAALAQLGIAFLATGLAVIWPFVPTGIDVPSFVEQRFGVTTGTWSFSTMHAFNLWALRQHNILLVPDSTTWAGVSLHTWGWLLLGGLTLAVCVVVGLCMPRLPRAQVILPAACVLIVGFFMLLTRIHERHLLPALPLLALTGVLWPRFWPFFIWFSISYLLNLHFVARALFGMPEPLLGRWEVPLVSALNLAALVAMTLLLIWTLARSVPSAHAD